MSDFLNGSLIWKRESGVSVISLCCRTIEWKQMTLGKASLFCKNSINLIIWTSYLPSMESKLFSLIFFISMTKNRIIIIECSSLMTINYRFGHVHAHISLFLHGSCANVLQISIDNWLHLNPSSCPNSRWIEWGSNFSYTFRCTTAWEGTNLWWLMLAWWKLLKAYTISIWSSLRLVVVIL